MCLCSFLLDLDILIESDFFKFFSSNEGKNFFSSDKLDLAVSYFQVSKENTKYKRHNNSMEFSTTELPQVPQLTCMESFLNTAFHIHCKN